MGKTRLAFLSVFIAAVMVFTNPIFLFDSKINEDLIPYWNREIETIRSTCTKGISLPTNIVVDFGDTDDAIGYCQRYSNGFKIVINKDYWNRRLDDLGKRQLLLHEMCHCIFHVKHDESNPKHFMYPEYTKIDQTSLLSQLEEILKKSNKCLF